ncbi:nucleotidyltransferase family protein [Mycolicibacterium aubagnense]|nr:nucleotidyltransferase domain-containing protein [Mycolicibacterium aubagnense]
MGSTAGHVKDQMSPDSDRLLRLLRHHRGGINRAARARGAANIRVCGSVAAGVAQGDSDIDLLVDFPGQSAGQQFMNSAGLSVELEELLGVGVDVLVLKFAREDVAASISRGKTIPL